MASSGAYAPHIAYGTVCAAIPSGYATFFMGNCHDAHQTTSYILKIPARIASDSAGWKRRIFVKTHVLTKIAASGEAYRATDR